MIDFEEQNRHSITMVQRWERLAWIGVAILGVALGIAGGAAREKTRATEVKEATPAPGRHGRNDRAPDQRTSRDTDPREDEAVRNLAKRTLSIPHRTERYHGLMAMLDRTTPENWNVLWQEYIRQTLEEGRIHETEWSLFMNRVGEVAGADAMEYFSHNGQENETFNRREVLSGWAAVDPQGALGWLKRQPADSQQAEFWGAVMRGAASSNTGMAMELLSEIPEELSQRVVRDTADGLIQTSGLEGAADLLAKTLADLPAGNPPPARLSYFYQELKARAERMIWLSESYPEINAKIPSLEALHEKFSPVTDE